MLSSIILLRFRRYNRLLYNSIITTKIIKNITRKYTILVYIKIISFNNKSIILVKIVLKDRKYLIFSS